MPSGLNGWILVPGDEDNLSLPLMEPVSKLIPSFSANIEIQHCDVGRSFLRRGKPILHAQVRADRAARLLDHVCRVKVYKCIIFQQEHLRPGEDVAPIP